MKRVRELTKLRKKLATKQGGLCYHCNKPLLGPSGEERFVNLKKLPSNFLRYPHHIYYEEGTKEPLGAVHSYCHAVLLLSET